MEHGLPLKEIRKKKVEISGLVCKNKVKTTVKMCNFAYFFSDSVNEGNYLSKTNVSKYKNQSWLFLKLWYSA